MKQIDINELLKDSGLQKALTSAKERRLIITDQMDSLSKIGKNCFSCEGFCCTFVHNSMQVTPIETVEMINYLIDQKRLNLELVDTLQKTIAEYRLDKEVSLKKDTSFRRTYTCPFFQPGPKGCTIAPYAKPYGCLAFNPLEENVSTEGHCTSDLEVLESRQSKFELEENIANEKLREELGLYWSKLPIPKAIIELMKAVGI